MNKLFAITSVASSIFLGPYTDRAPTTTKMLSEVVVASQWQTLLDFDSRDAKAPCPPDPFDVKPPKRLEGRYLVVLRNECGLVMTVSIDGVSVVYQHGKSRALLDELTDEMRTMTEEQSAETAALRRRNCELQKSLAALINKLDMHRVDRPEAL